MDATDQAATSLIPTRSRQKISHRESYPVGAEKLSATLQSADQFGKLVLHFWQEYDRDPNAARFAYLQVSYLSRRGKLLASGDEHGLPLFNEWEIVVFAVPRGSRNIIHQHLLEHDAQEIGTWLGERSNLSAGSDFLNFLFDAARDEFRSERSKKAEPVLTRSRR